MTKIEELTTKIISEILKPDEDVDILFQCLGLSRYLTVFKKEYFYNEILGKDGNAKIKKKFCSFAEELTILELQELKEELKGKLLDMFFDDSLSFLQGFKVFVTYMYLNYNNTFQETKGIVGSKQIVFAIYCWNRLIESITDEEEIKLCCEKLMLL